MAQYLALTHLHYAEIEQNFQLTDISSSNQYPSAAKVGMITNYSLHRIDATGYLALSKEPSTVYLQTSTLQQKNNNVNFKWILKKLSK